MSKSSELLTKRAITVAVEHLEEMGRFIRIREAIRRGSVWYRERGRSRELWNAAYARLLEERVGDVRARMGLSGSAAVVAESATVLPGSGANGKSVSIPTIPIPAEIPKPSLLALRRCRSMEEAVEPSRFPSLTAPARKVAQWVASNLSNAEPEPENCPCPAAWSMLIWVRRSESNEREFWQSIYPKLMPNRAQMESEDRKEYDDSSDRVQELIAELQS